VHSPERVIYAYDYTASSGAIANPRVFWTLATSSEPDGFAIDVDGYIWQAVYGDGKVLRISPAGELVGEIVLPTRNVTCCAFEGTTLWITTAAEGDKEGFPESARKGGALYRVEVGIGGVEKNRFRLDEAARKVAGL
jgi:sugar lactone lactonase YvrE